MKRTWTIIGVRDVADSLHWYQSLFGQPETPPAHPDFGQLVDSDGTVLLCLHEWGAHEHPSLTRRPVMVCCCFSVSMISARPCRGHARSSQSSKKSPTSIRAREPTSSLSEIPTATT